MPITTINNYTDQLSQKTSPLTLALGEKSWHIRKIKDCSIHIPLGPLCFGHQEITLPERTHSVGNYIERSGSAEWADGTAYRAILVYAQQYQILASSTVGRSGRSCRADLSWLAGSPSSDWGYTKPAYLSLGEPFGSDAVQPEQHRSIDLHR